ncbi:radical SAM superfamily protein [Variibacter gotjawalensis]|uniref:Radical SAM superfamily protein n=1 Tax=Variibacter gotjawalensis TaxID=1333996 RepID=A0A0S3PUS6_9BRAD|nr:MSMEG_0568 family radical SAM protein [Variibacter gotjawalensis]RZS45893.1 radical SAM protein (TIGR04043 family) [Variibacter gotjawalensis]BAT59568.1 radical SAM superfamily protein [Variibacter gotjawalensis]
MPTEQLINELQTYGVRLVDPKATAVSRRGGAGPSDHSPFTIDGATVMVPIHNAPAFESPYLVEKPDAAGRSRISRDGIVLSEVSFPLRPKFYDLTTADGVPYSKIAVLHGRDVLATTVLQTCIRYQSRTKTCQFCAIGQSLAAGRTIAHKTPAQLAEVAKAAVELDGVKHMVMTTGTPPGTDRGAAILATSAAAVKAAVDLPIQVQCEPPDDDAWFGRMRDAGADALGMHLEAVTEDVRHRIMPGKAQVSVERYFSAFQAAVPVFGRGQVSTYILAGLGDSQQDILAICERLVRIGVYPFVVPFVPIAGTPLESHPTPNAAFMHGILQPLARMLGESGLRATDVKAGCAKCGACSALKTYERGLVA